METLRSLRHVSRQVGGPASAVRDQAFRGILVPALVLLSLGATAVASSAHHVSGHVLPSTHQSANHPALQTRADSMKACKDKMPWLYKATGSTPRMDAVTTKMPWLYTASTTKMPWLYTTDISSKMPWLYTANVSRRMPWLYRSPATSKARVVCLAHRRPS